MDLATILRTSDTLAESVLLQARRMSEVMRLPLCHVLLRYGFVDGKRLVLLLGKTLGLAPVDVDRVDPSPALVAVLPEDVSLALRALPVAKQYEGLETVVAVAMTDPTDAAALRQIGKRFGLRARPLLAEDGALERAIRRHHAAQRVPLDDEDGEADALPSVVGRLLVASASELLGEPDPFDPISADQTQDIPSLPLHSFEGLPPAQAPTTDVSFGRAPDTLSGPTNEDLLDEPTRVVEPFVKRRVCFVSDDPALRKSVAADTRDLLENFYTEASIAHVLEVGGVEDVILYRPKADARTRQLLARLAETFPAPPVVVLAEDDALEDAPGVVERLLPPEEDRGLAAVVVDVLARRR